MNNHIVITPSHICDPGIAIAAIRSGETGILDLGYGNNHGNILRSLGLLDQLVGDKTNWGVRWDALGDPLRSPDTFMEYIGTTIPTIILAGIDHTDMEKEIRAARHCSENILLEVTTSDAAISAQKAGADGVIIKGNEAGGYTGRESAFILVQQLSGKLDIPWWVWGGMGLHTTPSVCLAGAEGGVFCEQMWLSGESSFSMAEKKLWKRLDGSETICLGDKDIYFRLYSLTGRSKIRSYELRLAESNNWQSTMNELLVNSDSSTLIPCGQDIGLASHLDEEFQTVGGILGAIKRNTENYIERAEKNRSLSQGSPLAAKHGTRFPIVQGPMANVSDVAKFSKAIALEGGLPFIALAALPGPLVKNLLEEMQAEMEEMNWGIGTLGFLPAMLRNEQFEVIRNYKPPFAIIAGGRPGLAIDYEAEGISTYLHVPSPGLLNQFLKKDTCRFIFEGRECGGHVGPLSSFILWESAINTLLSGDIGNPENIQVLFAGGIHDALSSAMVQVLASPLTAMGINYGIIMGSAYLFTEESVKCGAITPEYQRQAVECRKTQLLQSGAGHASSCIETPFIDKFYQEKQRLILSGKTDAEILHELELLNLGRLRLAAKGISTSYTKSDNEDHVGHIQVEQIKVDDETQRKKGVFMIGQVAGLHDRTCTINDLHRNISVKSLELLESSQKELYRPEVQPETSALTGDSEDIAIIGMGCILPEANSIKEYWHNILNLVSAVREIPENRWSIEDYFEPDRQSPEKTYSKWGGFLKEVIFDPIKYGMAPKSLESIDPTQLLALEVAGQALEDAGYNKTGFPRKRTSVIFGAGGINTLGMSYGGRVMAPFFARLTNGLVGDLEDEAIRLIRSNLPGWTTDSFPGVLANVIAGRITNRFDLGGINFACDAACASSFAALDIAIRQLRTRACDAALVGAVDAGNHPLEYLMFSRSQALSPTGTIKPLDDSANGIVLSEGTAAIVIKRLRDAEKAGDRVYAVIKGIGGSSDGRNKSLVAPNSEGQVRAIKDAYTDGGVNPARVKLVEMHGTGTVVGDKVEMKSYTEMFSGYHTEKEVCAVGSVKSMIGHTKITAGLAALIKTTLALKHKILPPTMGVEKPNRKIDFSSSPFYINSETRPWINEKEDEIRTAGLSCFGFGGCNFHIVMEEYINGNSGSIMNIIPRDSELFTFSARTKQELQKKLEKLTNGLEGVTSADLSQLAYSVFLDSHRAQSEEHIFRLNIVAKDVEDLKNKTGPFLSESPGENGNRSRPGVFYSEGKPSVSTGSVCFLYPGQGSQKINMFRDLTISFPETYDIIRMADRVTEGRYTRKLSNHIFPTPVFSEDERKKQQYELNKSHITQPAIGIADLIATEILKTFGIMPDILGGHSYGEYVALCVAGSLSMEELIGISEYRGRIVSQISENSTGAMAAAQADPGSALDAINKYNLNVSVANYNSPKQTVIAGPEEDIDKALIKFKSEGLKIKKIPVSAAFHTKALENASKGLNEALKKVDLKTPGIKVFSNTTSNLYPESPDEMRSLLERHICEPVRFDEMILNMYDEGARIFIETGPGRTLTGFVESILGGNPHTAISMDVSGRSGWNQLSYLLAELKTLGIHVDLSPCFTGRNLKQISTDDLIEDIRNNSAYGPMSWKIFGGHSEPCNKPKEVKQDNGNIGNIPEVSDGSDESTRSKVNPVNNEVVHPEVKTPDNIIQHKDVFMKPRQNEKNEVKTDQVKANESDAMNVVEQCNKTMNQFFEMQSEQHRTTQRFLNIQEVMLELTLGNGIIKNKSETPVLPENSPPSADDYIQPVVVTSAVPPSPTLPSLPVMPEAAVTGHEAETGSMADNTKNVISDQAANKPLEVSSEDTPVRDEKATSKNLTRLPDKDEFQESLIKITCENTGFPEDMLDLNMNMEADLGIDSIKKLEIFTALDEKYNLMESGGEEQVIEEVAIISSLGEIIDWYVKKREELLSNSQTKSASN